MFTFFDPFSFNHIFLYYFFFCFLLFRDFFFFFKKRTTIFGSKVDVWNVVENDWANLHGNESIFLLNIKYKRYAKYCSKKNVCAHLIAGEGLRVKQSLETFTRHKKYVKFCKSGLILNQLEHYVTQKLKAFLTQQYFCTCGTYFGKTFETA